MSTVSAPAVCLAVLAAFLAHRMFKEQRSRPRLPPSPKSYPLIGNLLSFPQTYEHLAYIEIGKQLNSKIISFKILGKIIIVLNDRTDAINIFEKRSAIHSDRPHFPMVSEPTLLDWEAFGSTIGYGERWRTYRRLLNPWFNKQAATSFHSSQEYEARALLQRLLVNHKGLILSENLESEFYLATAATLLRSIYGYEIKSSKDPVLTDMQVSMSRITGAGLPSNFLVNLIPALVHVPTWFPGAGWKRKAQEWRREKEALIGGTYRMATDKIDKGEDAHIIIANLIEQSSKLKLSKETTDDYVQQLAATLYGAGADTTASSLIMFFLAILLFPEVQVKAQKEIDTVVGNARLPTLEDQSHLGYVGRIVQEVLRWGPVTPLAVPHSGIEDDNYQGYDIPKGSMLIGNVWAMTRDEQVYPDPEVFNPDRFLDPSVPPSPVFGWGRRRCPGLHFAEASLFINVASILSTFDISPAKDVNGNIIRPAPKMVNSIVIHPEPFQLVLTPRSAKHESLMLSL